MAKKVNHVVINGETVIDLTRDTVTADALLEGVSAHNAAGEQITGQLKLGAYNITATDNEDGSQNLIITDAAGGSATIGYNVTFPAMATNWGHCSRDAKLLLADGTTKSMYNYSDIAGSTIENVVGILALGQSSRYVCKMTLSSGTIAQCNPPTQGSSFYITTAPGASFVYAYAGVSTCWWPLTDITISAITMYDTD